jgi:hypothetical protein
MFVPKCLKSSFELAIEPFGPESSNEREGDRRSAPSGADDSPKKRG